VGIHEILHRHPDVELILLDDAFQHRYVKPTISILLTSYFRLFSDDFVLPGGNLRECRKNYRRADIIIVTKCPENTGEDEMTAIRKKIKPAEHQKLYFSAYEYAEIIPAFEAKAHYTTDDIKINNPTLLLVTGIAGAGEPLKKLREMSDKTELLSFPDHHDFSKNDILKIEEKFKCLAGKDKMIITTEKDVIRLRENIYIPEYLKRNIFYLLIKVKILDNKDDILIKTITENVGKN
jgi:tetraacyldisaccharide 4'-kinase